MIEQQKVIKIGFNNKVTGGSSPVLIREQKQSYIEVLPGGNKSVVIGLVDKKKINRRKFILLVREVIALAKNSKIKKLTINFKDFVFPGLKMTGREIAEVIGREFEIANFEFIKYKTPGDDGWDFVEEVVVRNTPNSIRKSFELGQIVGEEINKCRALSNTPGGEMTPRILSEEAREAIKGTEIKIKVLDKDEIAKIGMGGLIGVSQGSSEEPRFIILEYKNGGRGKPIALIGKGVTFDTGGLNLKPDSAILEMHMDMSGGSAVIHTLVAAARLGLKKNIVGLIPAAENMPSGSSYRPGDILKSLSGKTIEVLNTDAEGRIILADALTYAKKYKPSLVIDVATLTGAAVVALGQRASAILTNNKELEETFRNLGEMSGDYVWPLPLWEEYEEEIKGTFGDLANVQKSRYGGAIIGATFLHQFIKDHPWIHIDIAPRMTSIDGEYLAKGAIGAPMRLLIEFLKRC